MRSTGCLATVSNGRIRHEALPQVAGKNVHLTNYVANVDATASIRNPINSVVDALFPPSPNNAWMGTHVTMELFGQDDADNPRYYKGRGWRANPNANGQFGGLGNNENAVRDSLRDALNNALAGYQAKVQAVINARLRAVV